MFVTLKEKRNNYKTSLSKYGEENTTTLPKKLKIINKIDTVT